jgi:putative membrane protein
MAHAEKQLTSTDRDRISQRIAALETRTDAEVVCAVATESGRYDGAESRVGVCVALVSLYLAHTVVTLDDWEVVTAVPLAVQVLLVIAGFFVGSILASYWHGFRRLIVTRAEMDAEVECRVHQVFSQYGVGGTRHRGGLLIYLSLFEHRLEIRCDSEISGKITPDDLETIRDVVLERVRTGNLTDGLLAGLDEADRILAVAMPHSTDTSDVLPNNLLVFHPRP